LTIVAIEAKTSAGSVPFLSMASVVGARERNVNVEHCNGTRLVETLSRDAASAYKAAPNTPM